MVELEALRGIAALVVLIFHSLLAFFPRFIGLTEPDAPYSLFGTPLFAAINGSAAVILFFVLSGFVLTVKAFRQQDYSSLKQTAIKRWPRLMLPVLIVNVVSGFLAGWGFYQNATVAADLNSIWLGWQFANPPGGVSDLTAAAYEGAISTFLFNSYYFNSSLWTMVFEFFGSFLCLATAWLMLLGQRLGFVAFFLAFTILIWSGATFFLPFLVGVGLSRFYTSRWWYNVSNWVSQQGLVFWVLSVALLIIMAGYHEAWASTRNPLGFYSFLHFLHDWSAIKTRVLIHTLAAAFIILLVLSTPALRRALGVRWSMQLGRMSFPIYLVQVPVICSVASSVYITSAFLGSTAASAIAVFTSLCGSLVISIPLMKIEEIWLGLLKRFFVI